MFSQGLFAGKRILVTGGGSGLGKAMAEALLALGAEIVICGRRKGLCEETAAELMGRHGGKVSAYGVDIRDAGAVEAMVEDIFRERPLTGPRQQRRRPISFRARRIFRRAASTPSPISSCTARST